MPPGGMSGQGELQHVVVLGQALAQGFPVLLAGLDELRQPPQLHSPNRSLGIERFDVEAQVAVGVLVVIAGGQLTQLPLEALIAGVVHPAGAPAVAAPVSEAFGDHLELGVAHDVHGAALAHGEVVGRIEALGADVTPGAGPADHPIGAVIQAGAVFGRRPAAVGLFTRSYWLAPASSRQHLSGQIQQALVCAQQRGHLATDHCHFSVADPGGSDLPGMDQTPGFRPRGPTPTTP